MTQRLARERHPRPRRGGRPAAVVLCGLSLLAGTACAPESDDTPLAANSGNDGNPTAPRDTGPGGTSGGSGAEDQLQWSRCGAGECAELDVPVDYDDPDGDTLTINISRAPATGDRIGPLFVNPGGPGASASDLAQALSFMLPGDITEHFDIVGVEPRGLGTSDIDCGGDVVELYSTDYSIDSPEDERELLDISQDYVDGCERNAGDLLPYLGTEAAARDIDRVRAAMGDEQLSYLGYSYGTVLGQMLADLFPGRVRAMVLDGVVDLGPTGVEQVSEQSAGFERALGEFIEDCDRHRSCPIGPDAEAAIDELVATVEDQPIPGSGRALGPGELALAMASPLYDQMSWPSFAEAIDEALAGDATSMVGLADDYLSGSDFDVYFAVNCLDFAWPDSPEALLDAGAAATAEAPHYGEWIVNDYVRCSMWPTEAEPLPAVTAPDAPPILLVSTTHDPATPYEAGVRTAERLESGVLLTYEGEGHTIVGYGVPCVDGAVTDYLVDLELPAEGTTC